jgi:hypothetical protein
MSALNLTGASPFPRNPLEHKIIHLHVVPSRKTPRQYNLVSRYFPEHPYPTGAHKTTPGVRPIKMPQIKSTSYYAFFLL